MGEARLLEYVKRFGFGRRTGIELPGESGGVVWDPENRGRTSIGSVTMGHELSATSVQLAMATAAVANGGLLRKPRLILWSQKPNERREATPIESPRRVIQPETAITLRRLMEGVVLEGTGRRARISGYTTGGKTGSAQIWDPDEKRYTHRYNSSFIGFAPIQEPKVVVAVTLNGADKYGGIVAAPVFQEVTRETLRILGVVPDVPVMDHEFDDGADLEEFADVAVADLGRPAEINVDDGGADSEPEVRTTAYVWGPRVPDLYGLTERSVLAVCSRRGMDVEFEGEGLVRAQDPPPGTVLPIGKSIRVMFVR
ncbi:MAG: PASTA domain-containing protein, partial [bacterium]|nr:PASTA domain-containing protein [bacterium]